MVTKDVKRLLQKLNAHTTRALEAAAGFAVNRQHYEMTVEHLLVKLLGDGTGDVPRILDHFDVDAGRFEEALLGQLEGMKTGNAGRPAFSPPLLDLLERAWVVASVHHGLAEVRSGAILEALLEAEAYAPAPYVEALEPINRDALRGQFRDLVAGSSEDRGARSAPASGGAATGTGEGETALARFTINVTDQARSGAIDPIFGRDAEVRQVIDILSRRRKNNPILVGEAGVGKTAVLEGLALRIAEGDVPESLREVDVVSLDLGLLQAGAGVKGEFEERLKNVIQEIRESPKPLILFIDEAHTLIGAGGAAGTGDAANLLKPALARGELRTVAATTWSEYKKHVEKDPALARRFQLVKVEEPSVDTAAIMLRGIKPKYEDHHAVQITDEAVAATASLSDRYIAGRQLPDKAVDLLDTAAARVKMTQSAKPAALEAVERRMQHLDVRLAALRRDLAAGLRATEDGLAELVAEREAAETEHAALEERWRAEQALAGRVEAKRRELAEAGGEADRSGLRAELQALLGELAEAQADAPLVHAVVDEHVVAQVVSDWTGIPIGNMIKDEAAMLLDLEGTLMARIEGQDEALAQIADSIRSAKAGLGNPEAPLGVFLLVGPSGVGKTETARALAELLFGGERFLISINMSEYQEAHTVSQLKGSPPGYVGYGEGGVLTEAVRQRPYSVVLLDEVEKAHPDVMELFFQVFDRGMMRDGEGREISFSNTVILATSNVGSDAFITACSGEVDPTPDELRALIHDDLVRAFQAALLARMRVVPFYPLARDAMARITRLKLGKIDRRLRDAHGIRFVYGDDVVDRVAERCTQIDAGARNIDFIIDRTVLPQASRALLQQMASGDLPAALTLGLDDQGDFTYSFSDEVAGDGAEAEPMIPAGDGAPILDAPTDDDDGLDLPPGAAGPPAPDPAPPAA